MEAFRAVIFFVAFCQVFHGPYALIEAKNESSPIENSIDDDHPRSNSRTPRKFFQKIHSGAAFLTGLKLGSILSNKGFELGHGSLASSHSFQLFGKSVNSALSLSYGDVAPILPLVDDIAQNVTYRIENDSPQDNVIHLTVIQNPSKETFDKLKKITSKEDYEARIEPTTLEPELYQEEEKSKNITGNNFFEEHNKRVQKLNQRRQNSKF